MIVISIRTDNPEAELGLFDLNHEAPKKIDYFKWQAHKVLSETLPEKIRDILMSNDFNYEDIGGIVCFEGPGSFTGLRIGISIANAFSYGLNVPVIGKSGDDWISKGLRDISKSGKIEPIVPHYGAPVHITSARK
jgi:tRNA threonylcarbamoyladenosine biosynthesis protein TsaB